MKRERMTPILPVSEWVVIKLILNCFCVVSFGPPLVLIVSSAAAAAMRGAQQPLRQHAVCHRPAGT